MKKIIVIGVIALFVCVGFQSAFAVESRVSVDNIEKVDGFDYQEVSKSDFLMIEDLLTELKDFTNSVMTRFGHIPEVKEKCQELLDTINMFRPLCFIIFQIFIASFGLWVLFSFLAELYDIYNKPIISNIFSGIAKIFYEFSLGLGFIYVDVFNCDEILSGYELGKLNEKQQIISI